MYGRQFIFFTKDQQLWLEDTSRRSGMTKSEIVRHALEHYRSLMSIRL